MAPSSTNLLHEPALRYAYPLYRNMLDNNIVFMYQGAITPDIIIDVLGIIEDRLEGAGENKRVSKKLFNIMVESFTLGEEAMKGDALLMVRQFPYLYAVSIGQRIRTSSVYQVKAYIDQVNLMTEAQLRAEYHRLLSETGPDKPVTIGGLPAISIIDLARKSNGHLAYAFEYLDDELTFFGLEARIKKK